MSSPEVTVTVADVPDTFGALVFAEMVAVPAATPVTGTFTVVKPAGIVTLAGAVATPVLLNVRLTTIPPAGAVVDKLRSKFAVPPAGMFTFVAENVSVALTWAGCT